MKTLLILLLFVLGNNGMIYVGETEETDFTITEGNAQVIYTFVENYSKVPDYIIDGWDGLDNPSCIVTKQQISITASDTLGRSGHISIIVK